MTLVFIRWAGLALVLVSSFAVTGGVQTAWAQPTAGAVFSDCDSCPAMVVIPPGRFLMGSERGEFVLGETRPETPVHPVSIRRAFAAGRTEVTNGQFGDFIAATGYRPSTACTKWKGEVVLFGGNWRDPDYGRSPSDDEPVVCVSWLDAKAYTTWLSGKTGERYRLLSEAEWEYVARDGTQSTWSWGEDADLACETGNVFDRQGVGSDYAKEHSSWEPVDCDDGFPRVAPVGSFPANSFGLHDLGGNVWEWNEDCSVRFYPEEATDESPWQVDGHCELRSVKGGSWFSKISRHRPAFRGRDPETLASHIFGFRVARDLAQDESVTEADTFSVVEATIPQMQAALRDGRTTSRQLVIQYLARIGLYENKLNAAISVNVDALAQADVLDRERAAGKLRGPLHGIPIALKDNIHTTDMPTTAGTLAFEGLIPPYEATLTQNLRTGGAIIIAKTVLTEMANWMVLGMPNNYSALGGYAFNPYDPRRDPRPGRNDGRGVLPTGSSSSGGGTAASLWAANLGTETTVSIIGPASAAMLAAIKPTIGRISRHGIVPVTFDQDTAGPMTRTVTDAAILLGVLEGKVPDPNDAATQRCQPPPANDYTPFLKADGLKGARIGVPRAWFIDAMTLPRGDKPSGGIPDDQKQMMEEVVAILRAEGATVVDPADIPSVLAERWEENGLVRGSCSRRPSFKGDDANCSVVLKYGFKRDFTAWLASLGATAPVESLAALRQWNIDHASLGTLKYAQNTLDLSDEQDLNSEEDRLRYEMDRERDVRLAGADGADALMQRHKLDALIFAGSRGSSFLAKAGYPSVIVPFGMVANGSGYPAGFTPRPAPLGVSFGGTACSEPRLLELAYAFEQATQRRVPPEL